MRIRRAAVAIAAAVVLAAAGVPTAVHAIGRSGHGPAGGGADHILHMAKVLGLTDAQTAQIETIVAHHKDGAPGVAMHSMREAREALARTIHDTAATDDQVRDAAATVAALESQLAVTRHQLAIDISAVLSDEQKTKLAELRASFIEHHRGSHVGDHGEY